jgi:hypothetical protein
VTERPREGKVWKMIEMEERWVGGMMGGKIEMFW